MNPRYQNFVAKTIDDLNIGVREHNVLVENGCKTIADVVQYLYHSRVVVSNIGKEKRRKLLIAIIEKAQQQKILHVPEIFMIIKELGLDAVLPCQNKEEFDFGDHLCFISIGLYFNSRTDLVRKNQELLGEEQNLYVAVPMSVGTSLNAGDYFMILEYEMKVDHKFLDLDANVLLISTTMDIEHEDLTDYKSHYAKYFGEDGLFRRSSALWANWFGRKTY